MQLTKIVAGNSVNFNKESLSSITATLRWGQQSFDVDLGALVKTDAGVTVLQGLGNLFGRFGSDPYVELDHDARTGGDAETLRINLAGGGHIQHVLVYAYIYEGGYWNDLSNATVTVEHPEASFVIDLDKGGQTKSVALFELIPDGKGGFHLQPLVKFFAEYQATISEYYDAHHNHGWNIAWGVGTK